MARHAIGARVEQRRRCRFRGSAPLPRRPDGGAGRSAAAATMGCRRKPLTGMSIGVSGADDLDALGRKPDLLVRFAECRLLERFARFRRRRRASTPGRRGARASDRSVRTTWAWRSIGKTSSRPAACRSLAGSQLAATPAAGSASADPAPRRRAADSSAPRGPGRAQSRSSHRHLRAAGLRSGIRRGSHRPDDFGRDQRVAGVARMEAVGRQGRRRIERRQAHQVDRPERRARSSH